MATTLATIMGPGSTTACPPTDGPEVVQECAPVFRLRSPVAWVCAHRKACARTRMWARAGAGARRVIACTRLKTRKCTQRACACT
eukprot:4566376-Alexandrium_andersonii.AAC.1